MPGDDFNKMREEFASFRNEARKGFSENREAVKGSLRQQVAEARKKLQEVVAENQPDARKQATTEYAGKVAEENTWKEYKVQEAVSIPKEPKMEQMPGMEQMPDMRMAETGSRGPEMASPTFDPRGGQQVETGSAAPQVKPEMMPDMRMAETGSRGPEVYTGDARKQANDKYVEETRKEWKTVGAQPAVQMPTDPKVDVMLMMKQRGGR